MPMLTDLKLVSCEGINSSSMAALSHCVMLEVGIFTRISGAKKLLLLSMCSVDDSNVKPVYYLL